MDDMKNLKLRVAGSNLLMECYKRWGADATNMNWSETYTALQQKTVEGQENPLPAIDAASVQEVTAVLLLMERKLRLPVLLHQPGTVRQLNSRSSRLLWMRLA